MYTLNLFTFVNYTDYYLQYLNPKKNNDQKAETDQTNGQWPANILFYLTFEMYFANINKRFTSIIWIYMYTYSLTHAVIGQRHLAKKKNNKNY